MKDPTKWSVARYAKLCRDTNEGLNDSAEESGTDSASIAYEVAQSVLEMEKGLEDFMKTKLKCLSTEGAIGCLADDICYPGNCKAYK